MNWHQRLDILRWRSLEEADAGAELLSVDKRREATARTRGELRASDEEPLPSRLMNAFLERRSDWLEKQAANEKTRSALKQLVVPSGHWWWAFAGWALAFVAGFGLTGIGTEREINLLALPLVGLLLWNAVVMIGGVIFEVMPAKKRDEGEGWLAAVAMRFSPGTTKGNRSTQEEMFHGFAWPLAIERMKSASRAWLHVAAAVLALGSCTGMYAKGWSHEYRAVWESTLLKSDQAEAFFSTLFWPASKAIGIPVPVQDLPLMQRMDGKAKKPADALPWIHLYATTLLLLVIAPRLLIAAWTQGRGAKRVERLWGDLGWSSHVRRLLRSIEGDDEMVEVLLHGMPDGEEHRSRWMQAIGEKMGGMLRPSFKTIPSGEEDEFAEGWVPQVHGVMVLFQLATTPEAEVQGRLVADLRGKLHGRFADGKLIVLLDASGVLAKWTPEHIASRRDLWRQMLDGKTDEIDCIGDLEAVNRLRVPVSKAR